MTSFFRKIVHQGFGIQGQIEKIPALIAVEMGMSGKLGIETVFFPGRFNSHGLSGINQNIQVTVNRSEADPGVSVLYCQMHIFGGGVGFAAFEIIKYTCPNTAFSVMSVGCVVDVACLPSILSAISIILCLPRGSISI